MNRLTNASARARDKVAASALRIVRPHDTAASTGLGPEDREHWTRDPREHDLPEDSALWEILLQGSYDFDAGRAHGLFGSLHGLRCLGARLEPSLWGVRLIPGEISRSQYGALRQRYLMPWSLVLEGLLAELAEMHLRIERSA